MEPQGLHESLKGRAKGSSFLGKFIFLLCFLLPIAMNLWVFYSFVAPLRKGVASLHMLAARVELKPRLEALIAESEKSMRAEAVKNLSLKDQGAVLTEIQELAKIHQVDVVELHPRGARPASADKSLDEALNATGFKKAYLLLDVTGSYGGIAHWLTLLDHRTEIRVNDFLLTASPGGGCQLHIELMILLRKS